MKHTPLIFALALLLFCACERSECTTQITGTLYTDSTLAIPIVDDTLWFLDYMITHQDSTYVIVLTDTLAHAVTDGQGRFAAAWWNFDIEQEIADNERKFKFEFPHFFIFYRQDTLFQGQWNGNYKQLVLYPGMPLYVYHNYYE